jgi:hypothetical protein
MSTTHNRIVGLATYYEIYSDGIPDDLHAAKK